MLENEVNLNVLLFPKTILSFINKIQLIKFLDLSTVGVINCKYSSKEKGAIIGAKFNFLLFFVDIKLQSSF